MKKLVGDVARKLGPGPSTWGRGLSPVHVDLEASTWIALLGEDNTRRAF